MSGITAAQADAKLAEWMAADTAVAAGQSYSMGGRALTRADAKEIRENIDYWDKKARQLGSTNAGKIRVRQFIYDAN